MKLMKALVVFFEIERIRLFVLQNKTMEKHKPKKELVKVRKPTSSITTKKTTAMKFASFFVFLVDLLFVPFSHCLSDKPEKTKGGQ